jgi:hypothetical protein
MTSVTPAGPRSRPGTGVKQGTQRRGMRSLGALIVALALAPPASAFAAWEPAQQVPAEPARGLEIGLDGRGNGVLAWTEYPAAGGVLHAATRLAGAPFAPSQAVSPLGQDVRAFALATTAGGRAALAWRAGRDPDGQLLVMLWRLGGGLGEARELTGIGVLPPASRAGLGVSENAVPVVAVARGGRALAAWLARGPEGCGNVVRASARAPGHEFGAGRRVSDRCAHARAPRVALTDSGWGVVTWRQGQRLYAAVVRGRRIGAAQRLIATPVALRAPAVAATEDRVVVGWQAADGRVMASEIRDGRVGRPRAVSRSTRVFGGPRLAASAAGAVAAVWQKNSSSAIGPVEFTLSPATGRPFSAPEVVGWRGVADGRVEALRLGLDRSGAALATWCGQSLGSRVRPIAGPWIARERIFGTTGLGGDDPCSGGRDELRLAVAQDTGEAWLAWTRRPRLLVARRPGPLSAARAARRTPAPAAHAPRYARRGRAPGR